MSDAPAPSGLTRYRVLLGAIVVQLILGTLYGYSIFWQPLQSEVGLPRQMAYWAFAICVLAFAATMVIAGRVQDIMGPRIPAIIGGVLMGAGFLFASFMDSPIVFYLAHAAFVGLIGILLLMIAHALFARLDPHQVPLVKYVPLGITAAVVTAGVMLGNQYVGQMEQFDRLFLLWGTVGFMAGAGIGFAYVCPIAALVKWFPRHKGLVSGLVVAGFGFGAFIFSNKDLSFSAENYIREHGIVSLFRMHGLVCLVLVTIGALMLSNPPGTVLKAAGEGESAWQDTLRRPAFYVLWLMYFSGSLAGLMVIGILKPFAGAQLVEAAGGAAAIDAATMDDLLRRGVAAVWWLAIFNAVGRIVWGFVSDRIGRTASFIALFIFQAVVMFMLGKLNTDLSLAVGASLVGFNYGGCFALFPSATADMFGAKNLGANYGWVFTSYGIAGVVGIAANMASETKTGSYEAAFAFASALCIVSAILAGILGVQQRRAAVA